MNQFPLIIFALFFVVLKSHAADFVPPELIDNLNPKGPQATYNKSRIEGWTLMSYIIDDSGLPQHVVVVNSSNNGKYTKDSIRYLRNLRFAPATYSGKKTLSANTFLMKHDKSFYGSANDGITVGFSNRYDRANKFISEKKFDSALEVLNDLRESNAKNLTEQALSAWLHSLYYYQQGNWLAYRDNVLEANQLREHLPTKMAIISTQNLLEWQIFQNEYSDAVSTLDSMANIKGAKMDAATHKTMLREILHPLETEDIIEINTTLSEDKSWLHVVSRSVINLSTTIGKVKLAELRCDNTWHPFKTTEMINFSIPESYLNCSILVQGEAGTQIKFSEKGELRRF